MKPMLNLQPEIRLYQPEVKHLQEAWLILLQLSAVCFKKPDFAEAAEVLTEAITEFGPK